MPFLQIRVSLRFRMKSNLSEIAGAGTRDSPGRLLRWAFVTCWLLPKCQEQNRNQILQVILRLTAFFKIYKMCTLLHRSKLSILAKLQFENQQCS